MIAQPQGDDDVEKYLYPPIEPFNTGYLKVSEIHCIYYEQCGGMSRPADRRFFDPSAYHLITFHQRGAGHSTPAFCLQDNDTWALVEDIEKLKLHLGLQSWILFGSIWGSGLALAYAETHIDSVLGLIMSGIFTLRPIELQWYYQSGASFIFPDKWEDYLAPIPSEEHSDLISAYHKRLVNDSDPVEQLKCAKAWCKWEMSTSNLHCPSAESLSKYLDDDKWCLAFARIETHYFMHHGFFRSPTAVFEDAKIIAESEIPVTIVQGRYDIVCPAKTAWDLYKVLPKADFSWVEDAGHSEEEVGITKKLVEATDKYKKVFGSGGI